MNKSECNELAERLKKQKVPEFELIFKKFYSPLCFFANRFIDDTASAEDIVSEIFIKIWQRLDHFDTLYAVKAFLYISTRNACVNHNKTVCVHDKAHGIIKSNLQETDDCFDEKGYVDVINEVCTKINRLPLQCKTVMQMWYLERLDYREIAHKMNLSVNTVKNQKARGIKLIQSNDTSIKEKWYNLFN